MRKKAWAKPELDLCPYYIKDPIKMKGNWRDIFKNKGPLHIELGCGKGVFLSKLSLNNPDINYVGIDISDDVLGVARRNIERSFEDADKNINNVMLTRFNIEYCKNIFDKTDNVDKIYIYFCNPWPRGKHHKRRLTHPRQLMQYKEFLSKDGEIYFKTDDDQLFSESQSYFKKSGFEIKHLTYDLYNSEFLKDNLQTEHEIMFLEKRVSIKFLIAKI